MKKYIAILLMSVSMMAQADSQSIGRISTYNGTTVSIASVTYSTGEKSVFMFVRDKYGVRKLSASMSKFEAKRLIKLIQQSIDVNEK